MALDREPIFVALFERLRDRVPGLQTCSRRNLTRDQVVTPALILRKGEESAVRPIAGGPAKWRITAGIVVLLDVKAGDEPDAVMNEWARLVELALERDASEGYEVDDTITTDLGGLVSHCDLVDIDWEAAEQSNRHALILTVEMETA